MQENYLIKNKQGLLHTLEQLHVAEYIDVSIVNTFDDLFNQIEMSQSKQVIVDKMMYYIVHNLLLKSLSDKLRGGDLVSLESDLSFVFGTERANRINKILSEINKDWNRPITILSTKSLTFSIIVFLLWGALIFIFLKVNPEFLIVTFNVASISLLLSVLIAPEIFLRLILPSIFGVEKFIGLKNVGELINELVKRNTNKYQAENYSLMRQHLNKYYGPFHLISD
jgi:hypothetical protein